MLKRIFFLLLFLYVAGGFFKGAQTNTAQNETPPSSAAPAGDAPTYVDLTQEHPIATPPPRPEFAPVPYTLCTTQKIKKSQGDLVIRPIITTQERDMSTLTNHQLAGTASAALRYFEDEYRAERPAVVNVLLMPSCINQTSALAYAEADKGKREVREPTQERGPSQLVLTVGDAVEKQKKGISRMTTPADYRTVGKLLNITADKAKELHMELALYFPSQSAYPNVLGQPAKAPEK